MAQYKNISSLMSIEWIKFYHDILHRRIVIIITHRLIKITDFLDWDRQDNYPYVQDFIWMRIEEVNYYLDAIWC